MNVICGSVNTYIYIYIGIHLENYLYGNRLHETIAFGLVFDAPEIIRILYTLGIHARPRTLLLRYVEEGRWVAPLKIESLRAIRTSSLRVRFCSNLLHAVLLLIKKK